MRVLDAQEVEIFFPIRSLLFQGRIAETCFNPGRNALRVDTRLPHVVQILVAGDGAAAKGALVNRLNSRAHSPDFNFALTR